MSLQLSRSPYYIKYVPSTSTPAISYGVVSVFIWSDTPANIPTTPTYTINKTVIGSDQFIVLEFSSLINDFIQVEFNNYTTGDIKNYYLETSCVFYDSSNAVVGNTITPATKVFSKGYGYFNEGANPTKTNGYASDNYKLNIPENNFPYIPVFNTTSGNTVEVKFFTGTYAEAVAGVNQFGTTQTLNYTDHPQNQMTWFSTSGFGGNDPLNEANWQNTLQTFTESNEVQLDNDGYPFCPDYVSRVTWASIYDDDSGTTEWVEINYMIKDKFTPFKITFINKYGTYEDLWCFGNNSKSMDVTTDTYKRSLLDRSTISYDTDAHQYKTFADQGKSKILLNTGYLPEQTNEIIKQLMLSEKVWITDSSDFSVEPVTLETKNIAYKTHLTQKLIDYQLQFSYAYDEINKVV